ncbi:MAG: B12-binding domain-containing radical SAM protein, partial [Candidatus Aminicenantia bacterium]
KSMGIPPSLLFLANSLKSNFHSVAVEKIPLEEESLPDEIKNFSWVGIPLYEDLFSDVRKLIYSIKSNFNVKIAVGGPMVTLSPLAIAVHLPEANLILRGEAEESLPELISLLDNPILNLPNLFEIRGFLYRDEKILIFSSFSDIPYPELKNSNLDIYSIPDFELEKGLEINTSRGCPRGCIYCSHVQGRKLRFLPLSNVEKWIKEFKERLDLKGIKSPSAFTVNINDDDLLLDEDRAKEIIKIIKKHDLKIWGIQTSLESIYERKNILNFLSIKEFYFKNTPLLWLGTDSFLPERRKRLGRKFIDKSDIEGLVKMMDEKGIHNAHYIILSDFDTDWTEFINELFFVFELFRKFDLFDIIPTSRFMIPYPHTPSFKIIPEDRIEKEILSIEGYPEFDYPLVKYAKPKNRYIHALLNPSLFPDIPIERKDLVELIQKRNFREALNLIYSFLKLDFTMEKEKGRKKECGELIEEYEKRAREFL